MESYIQFSLIDLQKEFFNFRPYQSWDAAINVLLSVFLPVPVLVFVRATIFTATHLFCKRGFWIFPNLFSDPTLLGPFYPLYGWDDNPKESLGLKWRRFKNSTLKDIGMLKKGSRGRRRRVNAARFTKKSRPAKLRYI
jgi:Translocation protein Sec62